MDFHTEPANDPKNSPISSAIRFLLVADDPFCVASLSYWKRGWRIMARVQKTRKVYVHNDLSQAATYFSGIIQEKQKNKSRDAIMFDGMACALMIAFAFEANLNFMGSYLLKTGKFTEWNETQSFTKKLNKVFGALGISVEREKRPLSSMQRMKSLRDTLAHGKPVEVEEDEEVVGAHEELDRGANLAADWEKDCTSDSVLEALTDLDALWKLMIVKSGINVLDTMTQGEGSITFVEHVFEK
jgi:hypothetical protein